MASYAIHYYNVFTHQLEKEEHGITVTPASTPYQILDSLSREMASKPENIPLYGQVVTEPYNSLLGWIFADSTFVINDPRLAPEEWFNHPVMHIFTYYSTHRPIDIGTYPLSPAVIIDNFDTYTHVDEINRPAWGRLGYFQPLTPKQLYDYELVASPNNPVTY